MPKASDWHSQSRQSDHPDTHTDDPDAPLRFSRSSVPMPSLAMRSRANTIGFCTRTPAVRGDAKAHPPPPARSASSPPMRSRLLFLSGASIGGYISVRAPLEGICYSGKSGRSDCARTAEIAAVTPTAQTDTGARMSHTTSLRVEGREEANGAEHRYHRTADFRQPRQLPMSDRGPTRRARLRPR